MPDLLLTFEFDPALRLTGVAIADRWTDHLAPENFGFRAVTQYVEQLQAAQVSASAPVQGGRMLPPSQAEEIFGGALQIIAEARQLMDETATASVEVAEPITLTDSKRRVTLLADQGMPVAVEISPQWLRQADLNDLEAALFESFARLPETAGDTQRALGQLKQRQQDLVAQVNDLRRR